MLTVKQVLALSAGLFLMACGDTEQVSYVSNQGQAYPAHATSGNGAAEAAHIIHAQPGAAKFAAANFRTGELVSPDAEAIASLYYDWAGIEPPIDEFAEQYVNDDRSVNDANRVQKLARAQDIYRRRFRSGLNVGFIKLNLSAKLSEYDATTGEFYVDAFAPGSSVNYRAYDRFFQLKFENDAEAYRWKVPSYMADRIVQQTEGEHGFRSLTIPVVAQISGVAPSGTSGGVIYARILSYSLQARGTGAVVGRVNLAQATTPQ